MRSRVLIKGKKYQIKNNSRKAAVYYIEKREMEIQSNSLTALLDVDTMEAAFAKG